MKKALVYKYIVRMPLEMEAEIGRLARVRSERTLRHCTKNEIILDLIRKGLAALSHEIEQGLSGISEEELAAKGGGCV
jgi:hypothetical protein